MEPSACRVATQSVSLGGRHVRGRCLNLIRYGQGIKAFFQKSARRVILRRTRLPSPRRGFSGASMPLTLFEEPARPPLIVSPVTLMKLIEAEDAGEIEATMRRLRLGPE